MSAHCPLISVIVPVYNAEKFLVRCLTYLVNQTYKNLEILVVDDGCIDNSAAVVAGFARDNSRIRLIKQKNSGPADARNNGLQHATGDYVHFHDADDFVETTYYEKMVSAINQSNADIICGEVDEAEYNFPKFNSVHICTSLLENLVIPRAHMFNNVWRYLYKREFLNRHQCY